MDYLAEQILNLNKCVFFYTNFSIYNTTLYALPFIQTHRACAQFNQVPVSHKAHTIRHPHAYIFDNMNPIQTLHFRTLTAPAPGGEQSLPSFALDLSEIFNAASPKGFIYIYTKYIYAYFCKLYDVSNRTYKWVCVCVCMPSPRSLVPRNSKCGHIFGMFCGYDLI